jgi:hypothetical protein
MVECSQGHIMNTNCYKFVDSDVEKHSFCVDKVWFCLHPNLLPKAGDANICRGTACRAPTSPLSHSGPNTRQFLME